MSEHITVGELVFEVRQSDRRKSFGITVDRDGGLVVHKPTNADMAELTLWVETKLLWVHRKLAKQRETALIFRSPEYVSGESFSYLGKRYPLKIVNKLDQPLTFDGSRFYMLRDTRSAENHFRRWYLDEGSDWLKGRVNKLSMQAGAKPSKINIQDLGFRWGSCGKHDVVYFNWKILQLPPKLVDYIIMHELIHLTERNHSHSFWSALTRAMPDWKRRKDALAVRAKEYLVFGFSI